MIQLQAPRISISIFILVGAFVVSGSACAESSSDEAPSDAALAFPDDDTFACASSLTTTSVLANLRPASNVDYVELRDLVIVPATSNRAAPPADAAAAAAADAAADAEPTLERYASHGAPCSGATDRDACNAALRDARIKSDEGWSTSFGIPPGLMYGRQKMRFLVYTRGDEVGIVRSSRELVGFLGTIDTTEEAQLLLSTSTHELGGCGEGEDASSSSFRSGWRKNSADGSWEFIVAMYECEAKSRLRFRVSTDGVVTFLEKRSVKIDSHC